MKVLFCQSYYYRYILGWILFMLTCVSSYAQSITIKDFYKIQSDMAAIDNPVVDQNGNKCALIRLQSTQKGFVFDIGSLGVKRVDESKPGEVWIYIPAGAKHIDIRHAVLGTSEQFYFPENIQSGVSYRMEIDAMKADSQVLNIRYNPAHAIIMIDGQMLDSSDGIATVTLPIGSHRYSVVANGYYQQEGSIELVREAPGRLLVQLESKNPVSRDELWVGSFNQVKNFNVGGVFFKMIPVDAGSFTMGSTEGEDDEMPVHTVSLSHDFYIGETEVTQELWTVVTGESLKRRSLRKDVGSRYPMYNISYEDVLRFIDKLNAMTGQQFRLPTEAEWEFAARGGNESKRDMDVNDSYFEKYVWYEKNSKGKLHQVASKQPNELGIYDMVGNAGEWCADWYSEDYYSTSPETNPQGPLSGELHVVRGGCYRDIAPFCRITYRNHRESQFKGDDVGFRLAL